MLKVKESAIKTMAGAAITAANQAADATQAPVNSTAIVLLNKKLRVGFGFSAPIAVAKPTAAPIPVGKTAVKLPSPKISSAPLKSAPKQVTTIAATSLPTTTKTTTSTPTSPIAEHKVQDKPSLKSEIDSILGGMGVKSTQPGTNAGQNKNDRSERLADEAKRREEEQQKKLEEQHQAQTQGATTQTAAEAVEAAKKEKEEEQRKAAEAAKLAEEKRKREEAAKLAEEKLKKEAEEKKRQEEERARLAEEAKKKAEEERKRKEEEDRKKAEEAEAKKKEEERLAAQEKLRLEKLRIQEERLKAREERRQKLAQIEKERRDGTGNKQPNDRIPYEPRTGQMLTAVIGDDLGVCLRTLLSKLRAKKTQFEKGMTEFPEMRKPLEQKKDILKAEIDRINTDELSIVERNEREIESKEAAEKAKLTENMDEQQERMIEQKLWAIEDQRKEIEKQRWAIEDQVNKILAEIEGVNSQLDQRSLDEENLKQNIKKTENQEKLVEFCLEKNKFEEDILKNIEQRDLVSPVLDAAEKRKFAAKEKFQELTEKEGVIKAELDIIEQQEKQETDVAKKRLIEQSRWKANSSLKNTIQTKWEAEEKLKNVTTETQTLQTKINAINEKIDKIQADIATKEAVLEGEGMPIRKMRDAITKLFQENGLEIDSEILRDIVQEDEPEKIQINKPKIEPIATLGNAETNPAKPQLQQNLHQTVQLIDQTAAQSAAIPAKPQIQQNAGQGAAGLIPSTNDNLKPPAIPVGGAGAAPVSIPLAAVLKPTAPAAPITPTAAKQPEEIARPAAPIAPATETEPAGAAPVSIPLAAVLKPTAPAAPIAPAAPASKTFEPPILARPAIKNNEPIPVAEAGAYKNVGTEAAKIPATPTTNPKTPEPASAKEPQEKAAPIVKPIDPVKDIKNETKPEAGSPYREPITVEPATNFRQFAQRSFGGAATAETAPAIQKPEPETKPIKAKAEEPLSVQEQRADVWQDRWGQIKKNTTPGAPGTIPTGPKAASGGTETDIEGEELEKPTGNNMMARILVVLLVLVVVGVALALILMKNNSPTPAKNDTKTETGTTTKTNNSKDDLSDTPKNNQQLTTLATVSTIPIVTDDLAQVPNLILPYTKTTLDETGYHKVTIQNKKNNTYVGLKQFFNIYKINDTPSAFYSSVSDDFILFIYANKTKNRIGFVTQITDEQGIKAAMSDWEDKMVSDMNNFYNLIGRKNQDDPDSLEFKPNTASNGTVYRSLTFAPASDAYTISYAIYNSKWLIFTTSEEALIKIFDQLPN